MTDAIGRLALGVLGIAVALLGALGVGVGIAVALRRRVGDDVE